MLLVDPLKRITIPEVRCHPWFTEHLPRYLAVMQADTAVTSPRLDEEMINEVREMLFVYVVHISDSPTGWQLTVGFVCINRRAEA